MSIIEKIRAEIERLYQKHATREYLDEACLVLDELEDFLDTIKEEPVDLEKEIEDALIGIPCCDFCHESDLRDRDEVLREKFNHFYELGKNNK